MMTDFEVILAYVLDQEDQHPKDNGCYDTPVLVTDGRGLDPDLVRRNRRRARRGLTPLPDGYID